MGDGGLHICTGVGVLALHTLLRGTEIVAAVGISVPELVSAWANGRLRIRRIGLLRGDFVRVVSDNGGFDLVDTVAYTRGQC